MLIRLRLRFTDDDGELLKPKTAFSRRKHLCKQWYNDDWLHRTLATIQFLAEDGEIRITETGVNLSISAQPDEWEIPFRIDEDLLSDKESDREEVLVFSRDDDDDDEQEFSAESQGEAVNV